MKHSLHRAAIALLLVVGAGHIQAAEAEEKEPSLSEVNKQLTNPGSSVCSLTAQFNNFILENGHWNHNMLFQPVLPISLSENWNLISRPVIPLYQSEPHPIGPDRFRQTTAFGDIIDVEMLCPAHVDPWFLALVPTFIFPSAGSMFTGQETALASFGKRILTAKRLDLTIEESVTLDTAP
jgi:hypothetical protein